ncbi:MAG: succinylglutamate desuccinylase [Desulfobacca sp.]|uniref:succinylglutamate desuccinylase n=1 Tax=Desulfobacca sp. TaxID=2067990 RepID=UPI00404AFC1D
MYKRGFWTLGFCLLLSVAILALMTVSGWAGSKLLCVSKQELKGEETVAECLRKGEEFAIVDEYGVVRILSPREVELTKKFNPEVLNQRAFGIRLYEKAPEMRRVFGSVPIPEKK